MFFLTHGAPEFFAAHITSSGQILPKHSCVFWGRGLGDSSGQSHHVMHTVVDSAFFDFKLSRKQCYHGTKCVVCGRQLQ
jgi:hypothetical protein